MRYITRESALYCFGVLVLLLMVYRWSHTLRLYRRNLIPAMLEMFRLSIKSNKVFTFSLIVIGLISTPFWIFFNSPTPALILFAVIAHIFGLSWALQPPTILYLGSSCASTFALYKRILEAVQPHRLVVLFDTAKSPSYDDKLHVAFNNYRTTEHDWESAFRRLADIVPIVVVTLSKPTLAVIKEANYMLHPDRNYKTLFFVGSTIIPLPVKTLSMNKCFTNERELCIALRSLTHMSMQRKHLKAFRRLA